MLCAGTVLFSHGCSACFSLCPCMDGVRLDGALETGVEISYLLGAGRGGSKPVVANPQYVADWVYPRWCSGSWIHVQNIKAAGSIGGQASRESV